MKTIVRMICSNIEYIENKIEIYQLELNYDEDKIELTKVDNDKVIGELKLQLEKQNELLEYLLNYKLYES